MGIRIQMAELKPQERKYLAEGIKRLVEDDINVPFRKSEGVGNDIYRGLESLRQKAVEDACKRTEEQEKVQQAIANVTHDLKTPLALITGYAECVEDGMDDKNYAELIREKALQMNDTVLKIIDAARTDAEEKSKEKKLYKAGNFFSPLIENGLFDAAKEKGIKVKIGKIPDARLALSADGIKSVMHNLVSNAVKFTEKGGKISLRFYRRGKYFIVSVADNGSGISEEDKKRIFDRFFTGDKSRTSGGTGVGLSVVKETVENHGGDIFCVSKEGKGSKFFFTLPVYKNKAERSAYAEEERKELKAFLYIVGFPFVVVAATIYLLLSPIRWYKIKKQIRKQ